MAIAALSAWKDDFPDALPPVADDSWKSNLALYIADHVADLKISGVFASPDVNAGSFTWNVSAFQSALSGNSAAVLANAWEAAMLASTIVVLPGAFVGSDSPATKFSVVASAIFDPSSIAAGKTIVLSLAGAPATANASESLFPVKMRDAFLALTVTVTGTNSVVPTPAPLSFPAGAVA